MTTSLSDTGVTFADNSVQARAAFLVPVRQTILSGAAAIIAIGSGLTCNLLATTTPVRLAFARGFDASGQVDFIGTLSADVAGYWSGLTANVNNYLLVDRNTSTGALTAVSSILPYIAQDSTVAISVASGQHTYVYDAGQMYVGNGSVASAVDRVAVGECLAGAATITSVVSYAKQRKYAAPAGSNPNNTNTTVSLNHNTGVANLVVQHQWVCNSAEAGYSVGDPVNNILNTGGTPLFDGTYTRLVVGYIANTGACSVCHKSTSTVTAMTLAKWDYRPVVTGLF